MKLEEIMTSEVQTIESDASLRQAAEEMAAMDVGALPVSENDHLVGVITDRDITIRAVAKGFDPEKTSVGGIMTADITSVASDTELEDAAKLMQDKQIRRLLVTDPKGNLAGIVSLGDIAVRCGDPSPPVETLKRVSEKAATA